MTEIQVLITEIKELRKEVAELKMLISRNPTIPIPGKRCTVHVNCRGGSEYCNDGGPITDYGCGW